jgi:hypothetical protein
LCKPSIQPFYQTVPSSRLQNYAATGGSKEGVPDIFSNELSSEM